MSVLNTIANIFSIIYVVFLLLTLKILAIASAFDFNSSLEINKSHLLGYYFRVFIFRLLGTAKQAYQF